MSWSDTLKGAVGEEGLQSVLAKLQSAGFAAQVQSWLDKNKDNLPITADQIRKALGDEHVQQIAKSLGIPMDKVLEVMAKFLPAAVNAAGPAVAPPSNGKPSISA